jgi:hypothetical protein
VVVSFSDIDGENKEQGENHQHVSSTMAVFNEMYDGDVGIKGYIYNKSLSHSINTINKS